MHFKELVMAPVACSLVYTLLATHAIAGLSPSSVHASHGEGDGARSSNLPIHGQH